MSENHDDNFTHDGRLYSLDIVRKLVRSEPAFFLKTRELLWVLKHDTPDPVRVKAAKLRWPLLVTKWRGKYTVIDGLHRLERCRQRGIDTVPVKYVTAEMLQKALIKA